MWKSPEGVTFTIGTFQTGKGANKREILNTIYTNRSPAQTKKLGTHSTGNTLRGQPSDDVLPQTAPSRQEGAADEQRFSVSPADTGSAATVDAKDATPGKTKANPVRALDLALAFLAAKRLSGSPVFIDKNKVAALNLEEGTMSTLLPLANRDDVVTPEGLTRRSIPQSAPARQAPAATPDAHQSLADRQPSPSPSPQPGRSSVTRGPGPVRARDLALAFLAAKRLSGSPVFIDKNKVAALNLEEGTMSTLLPLANRDDVVTPEGLTRRSIPQSAPARQAPAATPDAHQSLADRQPSPSPSPQPGRSSVTRGPGPVRALDLALAFLAAKRLSGSPVDPAKAADFITSLGIRGITPADAIARAEELASRSGSEAAAFVRDRSPGSSPSSPTSPSKAHGD